MSLQRVFESARKLGVPVIITDPSGRDPMVVIPLEQFEALADEGTRPTLEPEKNSTNIREPILQEIPIKQVEDKVALRTKQQESASSFTDEISLDERFYLEPVDGEGTQEA